MDLQAYDQFDRLEKIMTDNNIYVPRLRGIRLMSEEVPYSKENILREAEELGLNKCNGACYSDFVFCYSPSSFEVSPRTRKIVKKYMICNDFFPVGIRWNNLHGKKRKLFKYLIKRAKREAKHKFDIFNRYCGRDDVLCIYSRIGGGNWEYYRQEVENQPWFIEKVEDLYDSTYCDIYARIKPKDNA